MKGEEREGKGEDGNGREEGGGGGGQNGEWVERGVEGRQWRNEGVPLPPLYSGFTLCSNTMVEVYSLICHKNNTVCFQQNGMHQTENSNET